MRPVTSPPTTPENTGHVTRSGISLGPGTCGGPARRRALGGAFDCGVELVRGSSMLTFV